MLDENKLHFGFFCLLPLFLFLFSVAVRSMWTTYGPVSLCLTDMFGFELSDLIHRPLYVFNLLIISCCELFAFSEKAEKQAKPNIVNCDGVWVFMMIFFFFLLQFAFSSLFVDFIYYYFSQEIALKTRKKSGIFPRETNNKSIKRLWKRYGLTALNKQIERRL